MIFTAVKNDIRAVFDKDPAARNILEVLLCYPGFHALCLHRLSHFLWKIHFCLFARLISQFSRWLTLVEIHPGAKIGSGIFIDHGVGVVIGETSVIGDGCLLYQGAVLGGTCLKRTKRHPTLGRNVEVGAAAIILGPVTIGPGARIGAGSVVLRDVPAGATAIGVPGRVSLGFSASDIETLEHNRLPDPVAGALKVVMRENERLSERITKLENLEGLTATIDRVWEKKKQEIIEEFQLSEEKFDNGGGI